MVAEDLLPDGRIRHPLCRFQYDIRFNFDPAQTGRRVGSEEPGLPVPADRITTRLLRSRLIASAQL